MLSPHAIPLCYSLIFMLIFILLFYFLLNTDISNKKILKSFKKRVCVRFVLFS